MWLAVAEFHRETFLLRKHVCVSVEDRVNWPVSALNIVSSVSDSSYTSCPTSTLTVIVPRPMDRAEALSDAFVWRLSVVCPSVKYIGRNSRTEMPRKTKIGTEIAHVTRDSDTTFKVKRSKVKVTRPLWLVVLAGEHGHTVMVTYPYAHMTYIVSPLAGLGGAYRGGRPPRACVWLMVTRDLCTSYRDYAKQNSTHRPHYWNAQPSLVYYSPLYTRAVS